MRQVLETDRFVSGSLGTGRLILVRESGTEVACAVLMCLGTLVDMGDSTFDIDFPSS